MSPKSLSLVAVVAVAVAVAVVVGRQVVSSPEDGLAWLFT